MAMLTQKLPAMKFEDCSSLEHCTWKHRCLLTPLGLLQFGLVVSTQVQVLSFRKGTRRRHSGCSEGPHLVDALLEHHHVIES